MEVSGINIPDRRCSLWTTMKATALVNALCRNNPRHFSLAPTCACVFDLARGGVDKSTKNLPNLFSKESPGAKKAPNQAIAITDIGMTPVKS